MASNASSQKQLIYVGLFAIAMIVALSIVLANIANSGDETAVTAPVDQSDQTESERLLSQENFQLAPVGDVEKNAAIETARLFVEAWARPELSQTAWFDGISPYLASTALDSYENVDPINIPASFVNGKPQLSNLDVGSYSVLVPTDGGRVRVVINSSFKVQYIEPQEPGPQRG